MPSDIVGAHKMFQLAGEALHFGFVSCTSIDSLVILMALPNSWWTKSLSKVKIYLGHPLFSKTVSIFSCSTHLLNVFCPKHVLVLGVACIFTLYTNIFPQDQLKHFLKFSGKLKHPEFILIWIIRGSVGHLVTGY